MRSPAKKMWLTISGKRIRILRELLGPGPLRLTDAQLSIRKNIEGRVQFTQPLVPARIRGATPPESEPRRRDGRRGFDGHSTAARPHQRRARNAGTKTGMWAASVVVRHPFRENRTEMPFIHNNQPIQTLSTDRADQPLAIRIRLRAAHRSLQAPSGPLRQPRCRRPRHKCCRGRE